MQTPSKNYVSLKARRLAKPPTLSQLEMLRAIWELTMEHGYPPSFKELFERLNRSSTNGVTDTLRILQREGWVTRQNMTARTLKLSRSGYELIGSPPGNPYIAGDTGT